MATKKMDSVWTAMMNDLGTQRMEDLAKDDGISDADEAPTPLDPNANAWTSKILRKTTYTVVILWKTNISQRLSIMALFTMMTITL